MRIAQVAPLFESVPPRAYGGTERVVSWLTEELVRQGHEVTLFASGDSRTSAQLVPCCDVALWQNPASLDSLSHHVYQMERVLARARDFDVVHFHTDHLQLPLLRRARVPALSTLHGALNATDHAALFSEFRDAALVSISHAQRAPVPNAGFVATVHHGMPLGLHHFEARRGDYLAFLGRASPQKGLDRALELAIRSGTKLKIAARIYPEERAYYAEVIVPMLRRAGPLAEFVGEIAGDAKDEFLRGARALLFPIDWEEPFGLVLIEALATGTPVIGWRRGSVPELIEDGRTGFVVAGVEEALAVLPAVDRIERAACRRNFERRFAVERMASEYVAVYAALAARNARARLVSLDERRTHVATR